MNLEKFLIEFQDHLAPKLDTYEQAIYLYIFRHTRLISQEEAVIGFKSARKRMACGIGENGTPMSEGTAYKKLQALEEKGCIKVIASEHTGRRLRLYLPGEIPGILPQALPPSVVSIEDMDFFSVPENRRAIFEREEHKCFYCFCAIDENSSVIEHVVSRPQGSNSYRNLVAACRQCNNRKNDSSAEDFLRTLYREKFLGSAEFEGRLSHLERLRNGDLKPTISATFVVLTPEA